MRLATSLAVTSLLYAARAEAQQTTGQPGLLGFSLDAWDYLTFAAIAAVATAAVVFIVWLAGLPGRIAIARNHPDAEAVKIMGWAGLLVAVPWVQAFIWAFKPTDIIDIRRFPAEERAAIEELIARLKGAESGSTPHGDGKGG